MFSIIVKGEPIDTSGLKVNLYLKSTFPFSPDQGQIEGSFAFNGQIPSSPTNKRLFGFPHRLEGVFDLPVDLPCTLQINGRTWYDAFISINKANENFMYFDLLIGYGGFASLIANKTLKDLVFPDPVQIGDNQDEILAFATEVIGKSYPAVPFNFPMIYNPDFYGDENDTYLDFMNHYAGNEFIKNAITINGAQNLNTLVPMPYLVYMTKLIFESFGYKPSGSFFENMDLRKCLLYSNFAIDKTFRKFYVRAYQTESQEFEPSGTILFTIDDPLPFEDEYGIFDTQLSNYTISAVGEHMIALSFMLYNKLNDPITVKVKLYADDEVIETVNLEISTWWEWLSKEVFFTKFFDADSIGKKLSIRVQGIDLYGGDITDFYIKQADISFENADLTELNEYSPTIYIRDLVPEKEVSSFLVNLQLLFGIVITFDHDLKTAQVNLIKESLYQSDDTDLTGMTELSSKNVTIEPPSGYTVAFEFDSSDEEAKKVIKSFDFTSLIGTFGTFAELPYPSKLNDLAYVVNANSIYIFNVDAGPGPSWNVLGHYHPDQVIGDGSNEVALEMTPLFMYRHPGHRSVFPIIRQKGTSPAFSDEIEDPGFRLLFYHGLQQNAVFENFYPFGSPLFMNPRGEKVGNLQISLSGYQSCWSTFLAHYYDWLMNFPKTVTYRTRMAFSRLKTLDLQKIYRIFNSRYIIKEAKVIVSDDRMADVEIECKKI